MNPSARLIIASLALLLTTLTLAGLLQQPLIPETRLTLNTTPAGSPALVISLGSASKVIAPPAPQAMPQPKPVKKPRPVEPAKPKAPPVLTQQPQQPASLAPTTEASLATPETTASTVTMTAPVSGKTGKTGIEDRDISLQTGASNELDLYLSSLSGHLKRFYRYPRRARQMGWEGTALIDFRFTRAGELVDFTLKGSSGHPLLDQAALQMLSDAAPLPALPDGVTGERFSVRLPVDFRLH